MNFRAAAQSQRRSFDVARSRVRDAPLHFRDPVSLLSLNTSATMGKRQKKERDVTGPSKELHERIDYLGELIAHLPTSLPDKSANDLDALRFALDPDTLEDGGPFAAGSRALEVAFQVHRHGGRILVQQRGSAIQSLILFLKLVFKKLSPTEREAFADAWLKRLVQAVKEAGAKLPSKGVKGSAAAAASTSKSPPNPPQLSIVPATEQDSDVETSLPPPKRRKVYMVFSESDSDDPVEISNVRAQHALDNATASAVQTRAGVEMPNTQIGSTSSGTQGTLAQFGWKKWDSVAAEKNHWSKTTQQWRERQEEIQQDEANAKATAQDRARALSAARSRKYREKQRHEKLELADESQDNSSVNTVLMNSARAVADAAIQQVNTASVSRQTRQEWRRERDGTRGGAVVSREPKNTNWFHPFLWSDINRTMRRTDWSPRKTVEILQRSHPDGRFKKLHAGTLSRYRVTGKKEWTPATLEAVKNGASVRGTGRVGILAPYPIIVEAVKTTLTGLRDAKAIINVPIVTAVLRAEIEAEAPELFVKGFKLSEKFVRGFLSSVMDWSSQAGTRSAHHIPDDAPEQLLRTFFRLRFAIKKEDIPPRIAQGVAPADVRFPTDIEPLRNATVRPLVKLYEFLATYEGRKIIEKAWARCKIPDSPWSLSKEDLYSRESENALLSYLGSDATLSKEIEKRCSAADLDRIFTTAEKEDADEEDGLVEARDDGGAEDDVDVPLTAVIRDAFGDGIGDGMFRHADDASGLENAQPEEEIDALHDFET
ncbi:hypothetical protein GGX14DRAFT_391330 [Mycena pura]|uniref:Uncharacterized protein n=1 Tax=Mycena pura TaxID=153505 RepID=A0AAD6VPS7_9AGAR|nr:hypothetical protein GGX14DRAFT_391330 [Mycena pura]